MPIEFIKSKEQPVLRIFVAVVLALVLLYSLKVRVEGVAFENLALKPGTSIFYGEVEGRKIHCGSLTVEPINECLDDFREFNKSGGLSLAIWLGNSQLHAVNQRESGEKTSAILFHEVMLDRSTYAITLSQPNANLEEHFLLFSHLIANHKVGILVLPLVFDDFREFGIRSDLKELLLDKATVKALKETAFGLGMLKASTERTDVVYPRDYSEEKINEFLEEKSDLWGLREFYRGELFFSLYRLRNWVFNIKPTTLRKVLPASFDRNFRALEALISAAQKNKVKVYGYIAPLRKDVAPPYDGNQYQNFVDKIINLKNDQDLVFANFDDIVPPTHWGFKEATGYSENLELDFMHFSASGHEILSKYVTDLVTMPK